MWRGVCEDEGVGAGVEDWVVWRLVFRLVKDSGDPAVFRHSDTVARMESRFGASSVSSGSMLLQAVFLRHLATSQVATPHVTSSTTRQTQYAATRYDIEDAPRGFQSPSVVISQRSSLRSYPNAPGIMKTALSLCFFAKAPLRRACHATLCT